MDKAERALKELLARVSFSGATPCVAVAYSGGLDSSVLLSLVHRLASGHALRLFAFHIHHGLNPKADAWLSHCEHIAQSYGVAFEARCIEVRKDAGRGVEEAAREVRYAALGELCRHHQIQLLLTAHHQDDQAETVLLQLMRGAGLPGLSGMPAFIEHHHLLGEGVALGRPMLEMSRHELEVVARSFDVPYIDDDSNEDLRYRRNTIRHRVLPVLKEAFPGCVSSIARSAAHMQSAQQLLDDLAVLDLTACRLSATATALDLPALRSLSRERTDNVLRYWLRSHGVPMPSAAQMDQIRCQMLDAAAGTHPVYTCGPFQLRRIAERLEMHADQAVPLPQERTLRWNGEESLTVAEWKGRLVFESVEMAGIDPQRLRKMPLVLRPRSAGERLKLGENRPSRSLKNLFQESAIPSFCRPYLPSIYLENELIFVAGIGMDVRATVVRPGIKLRWEPL